MITSYTAREGVTGKGDNMVGIHNKLLRTSFLSLVKLDIRRPTYLKTVKQLFHITATTRKYIHLNIVMPDFQKPT